MKEDIGKQKSWKIVSSSQSCSMRWDGMCQLTGESLMRGFVAANNAKPCSEENCPIRAEDDNIDKYCGGDVEGFRLAMKGAQQQVERAFVLPSLHSLVRYQMTVLRGKSIDAVLVRYQTIDEPTENVVAVVNARGTAAIDKLFGAWK